ncbi:hypothetical protein B0H14DRAFT_1547908 [Mycena olivaceomarginata]|nr:hypothetical protein B0H14DRAFT_1547908 [Mycena olivaceomarginata]
MTNSGPNLKFARICHSCYNTMITKHPKTKIDSEVRIEFLKIRRAAAGKPRSYTGRGRPGFLQFGFADGVAPLSEGEQEASIRTVLNTVDAVQEVTNEKLKGITASSRRWGSSSAVPSYSVRFLDTVKAARLGRMEELESLFEAQLCDPDAIDVLESHGERGEEDEDEEEEEGDLEEDEEEAEGEEEESANQNPAENGDPSTHSFPSFSPDCSADLADYVAVCARVYEEALQPNLQRQIFARARAMLDFINIPLSQEEESAPIKDSKGWGWNALHAGLFFIRRARTIRSATSPSPAEFDSVLRRFALICGIVCTHPAGLVLRPLIGQTVNGFFPPNIMGAARPTSPVLELLRGVLTRVLVITTIRAHSGVFEQSRQGARAWLESYLFFRASVDGGGIAQCGLKGCSRSLEPPPPGQFLFRDSKRHLRLSVMSVRQRVTSSGDNLREILGCSNIYDCPVNIWGYRFDKNLLVDWVDVGRVTHITCKCGGERLSYGEHLT